MVEKQKFYTGSPRISTEYRDCSMPLAFDQHKGCGFRCLYCFAYYQRYTDAMSKNDYQKNKILSVNTDRILNIISGQNIKGTDKFYHDEFIKKRKVIQWGALGDPFCSYERTRHTGLPILKKLAELKYPVSFSTKATWFTKNEEYMSVLKQSPESFHFKFSIITNNAEKAKKIECGVDSPQERYKAMKALTDIGCPVTLRLRPYIIGLTNLDVREIIKNSAEAGALSVSTEFFCLDTRATFSLHQRYKEISKILNFDVLNFYKKHSRRKGYLRLNRKIKEPFMKELQELCNEFNLKLYVSDPDFKELNCSGSCCGLPQTLLFSNYFKAQLTELLCFMRDNNKKRISWREYNELFKQDFEWQKKILAGLPMNFGGAKADAKHGKETVYEFNRNCWNNPNSEKSPFKYFNGLFFPVGLDEEQNVVYELKQETVQEVIKWREIKK